MIAIATPVMIPAKYNTEYGIPSAAVLEAVFCATIFSEPHTKIIIKIAIIVWETIYITICTCGFILLMSVSTPRCALARIALIAPI